VSAQPAPILAVDTSTRLSVVALEHPAGEVRRDVSDVGHRHGASLLGQIDAILMMARLAPGELSLIVAGTGPGSFTGLRVGLATAKTLAYLSGASLAGVASSDALRVAAVRAGAAGASAAVVLPAGAHDHYLARPGEAPRLVGPEVGPEVARVSQEGLDVIAVGVPAGLVGAEAVRRGDAALAGLADALLALGRDALDAGTWDPATLEPAYVALPRGVSMTPEDLGWSPDLRSA
jgi:tRNA threonylcarbamoyl adenosine modification protein YeaZ